MPFRSMAPGGSGADRTRPARTGSPSLARVSRVTAAGSDAGTGPARDGELAELLAAYRQIDDPGIRALIRGLVSRIGGFDA